jgi:hypothetical protein
VSLKASPATEFFVSPGPHVIEARWAGREPVSRPFEGAAGQVSDQELRPPAGAPAVAATATPAASGATTSPGLAPAADAASPPPPPAVDVQLGAAEPAHHVLPPTVFWVGTGLTVVAGGILTWSGLDTMSARDRFVRDPTRAGFDDGKSRETRTNVLIATTAVLGAATIAVGLFATDFGQAKLALGAGRGSVALTVTGSVP